MNFQFAVGKTSAVGQPHFFGCTILDPSRAHAAIPWEHLVFVGRSILFLVPLSFQQPMDSNWWILWVIRILNPRFWQVQLTFLLGGKYSSNCAWNPWAQCLVTRRMWVKQCHKPLPQITINRVDKPFTNGWFNYCFTHIICFYSNTLRIFEVQSPPFEQILNIVWWFQTFFIFHFIYGMSSFPLTYSIIFPDGYCTTNQL